MGNVVAIESNAFSRCAELENIHVESIKNIGNSAFNGCKKLTDIHLAEGLESIGKYAFCHGALKNVRIPKSVKEIGEYAFNGCENLSLEIYDTLNIRQQNSIRACSRLLRRLGKGANRPYN